jgi:ABC-type Co2+ transport system permease subunit
MAVVMPFVSYWVFRLVKGKSEGGTKLAVAAFLSGYLGNLSEIDFEFDRPLQSEAKIRK